MAGLEVYLQQGIRKKTRKHEGVWKLNIIQIIWLWQFQDFTTQNPYCKHGFARIAPGWIRSGYITAPKQLLFVKTFGTGQSNIIIWL